MQYILEFMRKLSPFKFFLYSLLLFPVLVFAQKSSLQTPDKPKLIIGIVIDQMRYDYLYRYAEKYGNGGFKRLMSQGFNNKNAQYPYVPTYTAPGHSCIFSGSIPAINGMVGNDWYSRTSKKDIYCTEDSTVISVGGSGKAGQMSPKNLLVTTITDQLRLASNFHSRVIGISQKDRASILPAGHTANAAYWLDSQTGKFITSSYYLPELPAWVNSFNDLKLPDTYLSKAWSTLLPISAYTESTGDDASYEALLPGEKSPVFPHNLPAIRKKDYELIRSTPFGNSLTKDFAIACLKNEQLGKKGFTDFMTLSFSSTDYIGHEFGPNSVEIEDTYLRLDQTIAELLNYLDTYLGQKNVLVFLTADHGVANVPAFNIEHKLPGGVLDGSIYSSINNLVTEKFGIPGLIEHTVNDQIYLNHSLVESRNISRTSVFETIRSYTSNIKGLQTVIDLQNLATASLPDAELGFFKNGYNELRSGDFQLITEPGWFFGHDKGTTHGTYSIYDTHVPLVWFGWKINNGASTNAVSIVDIAPTIASMIDILEPSGSIGKVIQLPLSKY